MPSPSPPSYSTSALPLPRPCRQAPPSPATTLPAVTVSDALQPVLEEVAHTMCCGLFIEYISEWQQQQQQQHRHRALDIRSMNPYFLERAQVTHASGMPPATAP